MLGHRLRGRQGGAYRGELERRPFVWEGGKKDGGRERETEGGEGGRTLLRGMYGRKRGRREGRMKKCRDGRKRDGELLWGHSPSWEVREIARGEELVDRTG